MLSLGLLVCVPLLAKAAPVLPALPNAFTAVIEANILNANYTLEQVEYFDSDNNRLRINGFVDGKAYANYHVDGQFYIVEEGGECRNAPGDRFTDETGHLRSSADLFEQFSQNHTYKGIEPARGIPCNVWTTETSSDYISFTLDWYFAIDSWVVNGENVLFPVRAYLEGNELDGSGGVTKSFAHSYEFVDFVAGTPDAEIFTIPTSCTQPGKALPEMPNDWSAVLQVNMLESRTSAEIREWYDYTDDKLRLESHGFDDFGVATGEVRVIAAQEDLQWTVSDGSCELTSIDTDDWAWELIDNSTGASHRLHTTQWLITHENEGVLNFTYSGIKQVRGIECDTWWADYNGTAIQLNDFPSVWTMEIAFAVADWDTLNSEQGYPTPVRMHVKGFYIEDGETKDFEHVVDMVAFLAGTPPPSVFDGFLEESNCPGFQPALVSGPVLSVGEAVVLAVAAALAGAGLVFSFLKLYKSPNRQRFREFSDEEAVQMSSA